MKKIKAAVDLGDDYDWILNEKIRIHFPELDASHNVFRFGNFTADFSIVQDILDTHREWSQRIDFDLVRFTRHLFFDAIGETINTGAIRYKYEGIIKTIYYLASNNKLCLQESDLVDYYCFVIMHGLIKNKVSKRPTALGYHNFSYTLDSTFWTKFHEEFHYPVFGYLSRVTESKKTKAIRASVDILFDGTLTLEEWRAGGSFNSLTLDYGQFYIHHCIDFFDSNFVVAAALKKTINEALEIAISAGLKLSEDSLKSYGVATICQFLTGVTVAELSYATKKKSSEWNEKVWHFTTKRFQKNYHLFNRLSLAYDLDKIRQILIECDKDPENSNTFLLVQGLVQKIILRSFFRKKDIQYKLLNQDISLHQLHLIGLSKLEELVSTQLKTIKKGVFKLNHEYFDNLGVKNKSTQATYIHSFLRLIEHIGITKIVALTGWRESEYGFNLYNFKLEGNADTFDSSLNACRYEITGLIPKTHGKAYESREVTSDIFISIIKQSLLTVPAIKTNPCLYSINKSANDPSYSRERVKYSVTKAWGNYVRFYKPFVAINNSLKNGTLEADNYDPLLLQAHTRANAEVSRVELFLEQDSRRKLIWKYKEGDLEKTILSVLEQYLSESTKSLCKSFISEDDINSWHSEFVMAEIIADCLYPTPHALRHIWAEAVLRRFDGDVGWAIRTHFKHLSSNMWRSYVTNKDSQRIYTSAKQAFVNSVLNNYAIKRGQGYAGPIQKLLRRLVTDTKTIAIEDLQAKLQNFGTSIVSIHSNPWGYCVLRHKHQSAAKCAENGEPNRQNASPSACLGCRFNLIQSDHIDGILLSIENDLKVLRQEGVPEIFVNTSRQTVQLALKSLIGLNADSEIIAELELLLKPRLS